MRTRGLPSKSLITDDGGMTTPSQPVRSVPVTYGGYLRLDDLLSCQSPATDQHDELLFVIIHQVYELWFKQILHEAVLMQTRLEAGNSAGALATARRIAKILKTIVGQLDVLETMTPEAVHVVPSRARFGQRVPVRPVPGARGRARPS